jgi:hypothetical protein
VAYSEESVSFDVLQGRADVRVCYENRVEQVFLQLVEEGAVGRLAGQNFIVDGLWVAITERCHSNKI